MGSLNIESKSGGRGARQVHLNGGAASGECVVGVGWWYRLYLWTVSWRNSTPVDAVHPQSGKFQTDRATVQGHMVHSAEVVSCQTHYTTCR